MNKDLYNDITKGKELIVRKKAAGFIEKAFRYFNHDFRHDIFKKIIYGELECNTPLEEKLKNFYDGYMYLLSNHKSPLSSKILNRFFYILFGKEVSISLVLKLVGLNFELSAIGGIDYVIDFHINAYQEMFIFCEEERFIISLMFFNYSLLKINIPIIHFGNQKLVNYEKKQKEYLKGEKQGMMEFVLKTLQTFKFQDKSYYKNLKHLTTLDICMKIKNDQVMLETKYHLKNVYLFGSFAKNNARIDSDIDLLLVFQDDITVERKGKIIEFLSEYYFNVFGRFIDIIYINRYLDDDFLRELNLVEKIF